MRINIIDDIQLLEGIVNAISMPFFVYLFKHMEGFQFFITTVLALFLSWILRKIAINNYKDKDMYYIEV